jgi:hypothetical protein
MGVSMSKPSVVIALDQLYDIIVTASGCELRPWESPTSRGYKLVIPDNASPQNPIRVAGMPEDIFLGSICIPSAPAEWASGSFNKVKEG